MFVKIFKLILYALLMIFIIFSYFSGTYLMLLDNELTFFMKIMVVSFGFIGATWLSNSIYNNLIKPNLILKQTNE